MDYLTPAVQDPMDNVEPAVVIMTIYNALNLPIPIDFENAKKKAKWQVTCHQGKDLKLSSRVVVETRGNPKFDLTEAIDLGAIPEPLTLRLLCRGRLVGQADLPLSLVSQSEAMSVPTDSVLLAAPTPFGYPGGGGFSGHIRYRCWVAATRHCRPVLKFQSRSSQSGGQTQPAGGGGGGRRRMSAPAVRIAWRRLGRLRICAGSRQAAGDDGNDRDNDEGDTLAPLASEKTDIGVENSSGFAATPGSGDEGSSSSSSSTDADCSYSSASKLAKQRPHQKPPRRLLQLRVEGLRSELAAVQRQSAQLLARLRSAEAAATSAELRAAEAADRSAATSRASAQRARELTEYIDGLLARLIDSGLENLLEKHSQAAQGLKSVG